MRRFLFGYGSGDYIWERLVGKRGAEERGFGYFLLLLLMVVVVVVVIEEFCLMSLWLEGEPASCIQFSLRTISHVQKKNFIELHHFFLINGDGELSNVGDDKKISTVEKNHRDDGMELNPN